MGPRRAETTMLMGKAKQKEIKAGDKRRKIIAQVSTGTEMKKDN